MTGVVQVYFDCGPAHSVVHTFPLADFPIMPDYLAIDVMPLKRQWEPGEDPVDEDAAPVAQAHYRRTGWDDERAAHVYTYRGSTSL